MTNLGRKQVRAVRSFYEGKLVVVAGVTGFLGANCAIALRAAGAHVVGIARRPTPLANSICDQFVATDLGADGHDIDALAKASVVFDCLGNSEVTPSDSQAPHSFEAAFRPAVNLLTQCAKSPASPLLVHVSSRLVYGTPVSLPVDERHALAPGTLYGAHKLLLENYLQVFSRTHGLKTIIFRLSSPYGPNTPSIPGRLGVWNQFIGKALRGETLTIYGNGEQLRDCIHIDDVVNTMLLAATNEKCIGETFNLGGEQPFALREALTLIAKEAGGTPIEYVPWPTAALKAETGHYYTDLSKLRAYLDLPSQMPFARGVRETIRSIKRREHLSRGEDLPSTGSMPATAASFVEPSFSGQKVMLVGASGFLGSHLIQRFLHYGADVCGVSRSAGATEALITHPNYEFHACDIIEANTTDQVVKNFRPDVVIFVAASPDGPESGELIRKRFNVNVVGLINVLEACCRHVPQTKFLFCDSRKVYGNGTVPHNSTMLTAPMSSYAFTKDVGWRLCRLYASVRGLTAVSVRPSLIYGPGQGPNVIRNVFAAATRGDTTFTLRGGEQTRDPIFIDDAVDAFVSVAAQAQHLSNKVIVIGGREEVSVRELARLALEACGSKVIIVDDPAAMNGTDMLRSVCDLSEVERLLGWSPKILLREGLHRTVSAAASELNVASLADKGHWSAASADGHVMPKVGVQ